jgi:hypothetical protein
MKTLFARHVKAWPVCSYHSSMHCYIQCWMAGSAECDVQGAVPTEREHQCLLDRELEVPQACVENFEKRKFKSHRQSKHDFSVASIVVTAPCQLN